MNVGFIGAGKMAQALIRGILEAGKVSPEAISASCPVFDKQLLAKVQTFGIGTATHDNKVILDKSDVIFLAVKPQHMAAVASDVGQAFTRDKLAISIAMGLDIKSLEQMFPSARMVRVMPNLPCVVRSGASGYSIGSKCEDTDSEVVRELLSSVGFAEEVPEEHLDAITGLAGSAPAYVFSILEAMANAGVKLGLTHEMALKFASHTLMGSAKMVLETGEHPAVLKDNVQSPGGSTIYGSHVSECAGLRGNVMDTIVAAAQRSQQTKKAAAMKIT